MVAYNLNDLSSYLSACKSSAPDTSRFWSPEEDLDPTLGKQCECQVGTQVCPAGAEGPTPPRIQVNT